MADAARTARVYWLFTRLERQYPFSADLGGPKLLLYPDGSGGVVLVGKPGSTVLIRLMQWESSAEGISKLWAEVETGTPESRAERGWPMARRAEGDPDRAAPTDVPDGMRLTDMLYPQTAVTHEDLVVRVYKTQRLTGEARDG